MSSRVCPLEKIAIRGANAAALTPPPAWAVIKLLPVSAIKQSHAHFVAVLSMLAAKARPVWHFSGMF